MKLVQPHSRYASLDTLLRDVRACRVCDKQLPAGARPVVRASRDARLLIVGQAPGAKVHASGVPWSDASGKRLRDWLDMNEAEFYDTSRVAIIPMGFCYPGRGASGDNPPRPECAQLWLEPLLSHLPRIELTLLVGQYAQRHFLGARRKSSLTETVRAWAEYAPTYVPLPHPSPRNQLWFKRHPWFADQVLPMLKQRIAALFGTPPR
ncbi:uracil-DNA glycosylase family protein [Mycetohabitans sp. B46]|uniref:uracil-DNA glycosylase family protein n=1 Tax=Mycetohabitans sp. B46 TaxID=2772536 RepID=UPI00307D7FB0